jgi:four helix bundle protein
MSQTRKQITETTNPEPFLPCERLDVYRVALEFRQSLRILETVRNISSQRDQLFRAADSIVLNIAEGAGRIARADKRRHYGYALGSAMECGAALALLHACGALRAEAYELRRMTIIRVIQMLYRLAGPPR